MKIAESDRALVARTLADALPSWEEREAVATRAGLGDVQLTGDPSSAWRLLVDEAVEQDRLALLVRAASQRRPDAVTLKYLAASVEAGHVRVVPRYRAAWIGVAVLLPVGAALAVWMLGGAPSDVPASTVSVPADEAADDLDVRDEGAAPQADVEEVADAPDAMAAGDGATGEGTPQIAEAEGAGGDGEAEGAAGDDEAIAEALAAEPAVERAQAAPSVAPAPTPSAAPAPSVAPSPTAAAPAARAERAAPRADLATPADARASTGMGPCAGKTGWAFIGESTTLSAGQSWVADVDTFVRAAPPSADNGWSSRTTVRCVLPRGSRVPLDQAPLFIPGGAYWVRVDGDAVR